VYIRLTATASDAFQWPFIAGAEHIAGDGRQGNIRQNIFRRRAELPAKASFASDFPTHCGIRVCVAACRFSAFSAIKNMNRSRRRKACPAKALAQKRTRNLYNS
jgi:hypothetical protein